ncbi:MULTISPECIES: winged helix DNA-binding domain-containing protein [Streptomyces]|uniref:winged helix DNA-binding domain-containing protein n=1 Tax=Streptomyces TaxID=1883 RepID=UPI001E293B4A|nr:MULTISPECIES: winged helix DNA-binding domain-containing protein [Streptomyces]UFQ14019.1 winged helix DNA-binding domain-containing protein [Streptomyces huasconensis]WCL83620.1 winged helix DNA-binding domain-containing protein [Streptomyces sp. JCM 35825]
MVRHIGVAERRARLALRHRLTAETRADDPTEVARSLLALHGTDPSSVYVGAWARMRDGRVADVERALYADRSLIRLLGMRRTVFVTSLDVAPVLQAACSRAVAARERRLLLGMLAETGVAEDAGGVTAWLAEAEEAALRALKERGEATAAELASDDPRLSTELVMARGKSYEGRQKLASRLLLLLAAEGHVVRGRPRGTWTSHQYRWAPLTDWFPGGLADWDTQDAQTELARRWLRTFGPATAEDLRWWTGWTKTQTKRALTELRPVEVDLDGVAGLLLPDDVDETPPPEPWAALLPALDSTPMGWQNRGWFLGDHGPYLFDRNGNIGPSLWWNGRIVGGWAQDSRGETVCRFLEDVGADARRAVQVEAERLAARLGGVRLTARTRGRTWLEEELAC